MVDLSAPVLDLAFQACPHAAAKPFIRPFSTITLGGIPEAQCTI